MNNATTYPEIRATIISGDIVAFKGNGILDRIIRWWTNSNYSHVGLAWVYGGRVYLLDSSRQKGVSLRPMSAAGDFVILRKGKWNFGSDEIERAFSVLGNPYSWLDLLKAAFKKATSGDEAFQCAEYVSYVLGWGRQGTSTPEDIVRIAVTLEGKLLTVSQVQVS